MHSFDIPLFLLLFGAIIVLCMVIKSVLERTVVPPLVGYLLLGFALSHLRTMDGGSQAHLVDNELIRLFGEMGLFIILFRVGLETNVGKLAEQLRTASRTCVVNVAGSLVVGFGVTMALGYSAVLAAFVGVAFSATSIGITAEIWRQAGRLDTDDGSLLLDIAELDDILAVVLMSLVFSIVPALLGGESTMGAGATAWLVVSQTALFVFKFGAFMGLCYLFSRYVERPMLVLVGRIEMISELTLTVAGLSFMVAAVAAMLDFSLAMGAFFAGLMFSTDTSAYKFSQKLLPIYELLSPFFFIMVGLSFEPRHALTGTGIAVVLFVAAAGSKVLFNAWPLQRLGRGDSALLIGTSMIPRAEIWLVVLAKANELGETHTAFAMPGELYGAMVLVSAATCLAGPPLVAWQMRRTPVVDGR